MSDKPVRLHIGCGQNILPGYVNIDGYANKDRAEHFQTEPDLVCDALDIDQHFEPESVDEIRSDYMLEHISILDLCDLLCTWNKVLKNMGHLVLTVPDFESCVRAIVALDEKDDARAQEDAEVFYRHIFGSQQGPGEGHLNGFTIGRLRWWLSIHGFAVIEQSRTEILRRNLDYEHNYKLTMMLPDVFMRSTKVGPPDKKWIEANQTTPFSYRRKYPREGK